VAAIANLRPQLGRWLQKTKTRPGGDGEIHGSTTFQPDGHIETEHGNSTQVAIDSLHRGPLSKTAAHELFSALSTALDRAAISKNVDIVRRSVFAEDAPRQAKRQKQQAPY